MFIRANDGEFNLDFDIVGLNNLIDEDRSRGRVLLRGDVDAHMAVL